MNESMRDLLRQGADEVGRPQFDVDQLVAAAEHRVARRRLTVGVAAAAAVAAVMVGALTFGPEDGRESPAPDPIETPDPPAQGDLTYFAAAPDAAGDPKRGWFGDQGQADLYVRTGLERPRRIIATEADERCATVSPDGTALAYLRGPYAPNKEPVSDVVVVPLDSAGDPKLGSPEVVLRNSMSCPQWSPDGRRLATVTEGTNWTTTELHVVSLDGKGGRLAILPPYQERFAWSPDGDAVAYLTEDAVWIAPLDGAGPELFWRSTATPDTEPQGVPMARSPKSLSWLTTGELAVQVWSSQVNGWPFVPEGPDVLHIISARSEPHETVELDESYEGAVPVWSPDDSRFAVADSDGTQILLYDRASRSTVTLRPALPGGRRITINGVYWSADGQLLSDAQRGPDSEGGPFALVAIPLDGSAVDVLSEWMRVR